MNIIIRIAELLIGNIFLTILAIKLFSFIRSKIVYLDIAIFGFLWIYLATLYSLLLGVFGLLDAHKIAIISFIGILIYFSFYFRKSGIKLPTKNIIKSFSLINSIHFNPSFLSILLAFFIFLQVVRCIFHIWYIPPYVWDTVVYHLVNVAEWVQKGKIFPVVTPVERVYWPANFEAFEAWFAVFLHNDLLVKTAPFLAYIVTGTSAYALTRTIGLNNLLSVSSAVFYVFTPSLAIQATACKNDVGISAVFLLSIAILMHILLKGAESSSGIRNQLLIVLMAFCLGVGIKPYMMFISPAIILIGFLSLWKHRIFKNGIISMNRTDLIIFILLIASSLFLGFYWYIRNLIVFDNPFHPTDFRIGDRLIFGTGNAVQFGPGQRGSASLKVMIQNFQSLITKRIFDSSGEFSSHLSDMSGWGWFNFSCGLSTIAYALIFSGKIRLLIASFLISLVGLFTFITHDPWYMRFTLWFPVIFALSFAFLISNLSLRWLKGIFWALAFICILLNWIATLNVGEISLDDFKRMMQLPPLQRSTAELTHHYDGAFKKALQIIPKDEIIGYCFPNNGWAYPLYDSDYSRHLMYVPIEDLNFTEFMRQNDINYLFIERITPEQIKLIQIAVENKKLKKLEEFLYALEKS